MAPQIVAAIIAGGVALVGSVLAFIGVMIGHRRKKTEAKPPEKEPAQR